MVFSTSSIYQIVKRFYMLHTVITSTHWYQGKKARGKAHARTHARMQKKKSNKKEMTW